MDKHDAIPVPANLSWEEAAAVPITFLVVYDMLVQQGGLKAGEWLLVTGVSAGVGVAALQAGKALGAKVIGTSGSADEARGAKAPWPRRRASQTRKRRFPRSGDEGDRRQGREPGGEQRRRLGVRRNASARSPTKAGTPPWATSTAC